MITRPTKGCQQSPIRKVPPGFTAHSRYPGMMAAAGVAFGDLVNRLVELGVGA